MCRVFAPRAPASEPSHKSREIVSDRQVMPPPADLPPRYRDEHTERFRPIIGLVNLIATHDHRYHRDIILEKLILHSIKRSLKHS